MVPSMTGTQALFQLSSMLDEPKAVSPEKVLNIVYSTLCCKPFASLGGRGWEAHEVTPQ